MVPTVVPYVKSPIQPTSCCCSHNHIKHCKCYDAFLTTRSAMERDWKFEFLLVNSTSQGSSCLMSHNNGSTNGEGEWFILTSYFDKTASLTSCCFHSSGPFTHAVLRVHVCVCALALEFHVNIRCHAHGRHLGVGRFNEEIPTSDWNAALVLLFVSLFVRRIKVC